MEESDSVGNMIGRGVTGELENTKEVALRNRGSMDVLRCWDTLMEFGVAAPLNKEVV